MREVLIRALFAASATFGVFALYLWLDFHVGVWRRRRAARKLR